MQYQTLRSVSDNHVFVICYDGRFDELPLSCTPSGPMAGNAPRGDREAQGQLPPGTRSRWVRAREVRGRGVQAGGLKKKGNTNA